MIAYGRNKVKYSLENRAARSEPGCQDFRVKGREDALLARIYDKGLRGRDREEDVRSAMEGGTTSLFQSPVDILYVGGRFAGFLYYDYSALQPEPQAEPVQDENLNVQNSKGVGGSIPLMVIPIVEAVLLSLLTKVFIYPIYVGLVYRNSGISYALILLVNGWVPAIAGCIAVGFAFKRLKNTENAVAVAVGGTLAYFAAVIALLAAVTLATALLAAAVSAVLAALPMIIVLLIIIYIIKTFLGGKE